jgi:hypothetical protein
MPNPHYFELDSPSSPITLNTVGVKSRYLRLDNMSDSRYLDMANMAVPNTLGLAIMQDSNALGLATMQDLLVVFVMGSTIF